MVKPLTLFLLLSAMISAFALCPDILTVPSQITCASPFSTKLNTLTNFPTSPDFTQLGFTMSVRLDTPAGGAGCTSTQYTLFALTTGVNEANNILSLYYIAGSSNLLVMSSLLPGINSQLSDNTIPIVPDDEWITLYFAIDLAAGTAYLEMTKGGQQYKVSKTTTNKSKKFDATTILRFCSARTGLNTALCTVENVVINYSVDTDPSLYQYTRVGGTTSAITTNLFLLNDGPATALVDTLGTSQGWLGDASSNPNQASLPAWGSSKNFVKFSSDTQVMKFKMPTLQAGVGSNAASFTISAWVRVTAAPASTNQVILKILSSDEQTTKLTLEIDTSLKVVPQMTNVNNLGQVDGGFPTLTLNAWNLVGVSVWTSKTKDFQSAAIFVDSTRAFYQGSGTAIDFQSTDILRFGDSSSSFYGDVSAVRIITPSPVYIRPSECSATSLLELGGIDFALGCSTGNKLYPVDNKCYASCPASTAEKATAATYYCLEPEESGNGNGSGGSAEVITESTGVSGGEVAGIVVGSIAAASIVLGGVYFYRRQKRRNRAVTKVAQETPTVVQEA